MCVHFNNIYVNFKTYDSIYLQFMDKHEVGLHSPSYDNVCLWGKRQIILGRHTDGLQIYLFFLKKKI